MLLPEALHCHLSRIMLSKAIALGKRLPAKVCIISLSFLCTSETTSCKQRHGGSTKLSKIITADSHCWLNGQASVGFPPLVENKLSDFDFVDFLNSSVSVSTALFDPFGIYFS